MSAVLKWGIPFGPAAHVPFDGHILPGAEAEHDHPAGPHVMIWSIEPKDGPGRTRVLQVFATGEYVPDGWVWRATTPRSGGMVWHVFERPAPAERLADDMCPICGSSDPRDEEVVTVLGRPCWSKWHKCDGCATQTADLECVGGGMLCPGCRG